MGLNVMANEPEEEKKENSDKSASTMKIVIVAVILSILLSGGMVGITLYLVGGFDQLSDPVQQSDIDGEENDDGEGDEDEDEETVTEPSGPPLYFPIDPKFVVSFHDQKKARFMQFSIEVMTRNENVIEQLKLHLPAIRSSLLLLFSSQDYEKVSSREGKEQFLVEIAEDINKTLEKLNGPTGVESAYFNSFVVQ